jgi:proton-coupled amino acid transporter
LAQSVKGLLAFAIFISHGLACFVASDVTWDEYIEKRFANSPRLGLYESLTRIVIVLITFILAILIPNLEIFISLVGSVCLSALGIAFPALIETCTFWKHISGYRKTWMVCKNIFIGVIALAGLVIGLYTSVSEIIETYFM